MDRLTSRKRMAPRARYACLRCRRQKLRCDNERPCALCVRSCVECEEGERPTRRRANASANKNAKKSSEQIVPADTVPRQTGETPARDDENCDPESTSALTEWPPDESRSPERMPSLNQDRPSTYGLVDQLLQGYDSQNANLPGSEAIPDATPDHFSSTMINTGKVARVSDLIGSDLPPTAATLLLFDVFIKSVHWFMMVFHEPSLRAELQSILNTGYVAERNLSTLILILVTLLIATKYTTHEELENVCAGIDVPLLQSKLLETVETHFLAILDQDNIGTIQVCILLSSFYFYHGRPNRCLAINSAAVRIAQNLKFHRESYWRGIDVIEREVRRRVWWALYVLDGYGSITYGTTTTINGSKCQVSLPRNIDDTSDRCPGFASFETFENEIPQEVTTLSYQRYKFRLYRIAEPIMGKIYFHDGRPVQDLVKKVQDINEQLLEWEKRVPPELTPKSFSSSSKDAAPDPLTRVFQLQALALQLSYDNIQLILHRPLLVYNGVLSLGPRLNVPQPPNLSTGFWETSKELCWNSARRTSCVDEYLAALKPIHNYHATSYIGIQTFTAGVMLGIFALSKPFSAQAQEAKRSIGRLIRMPKLLGYRTTISDQTGLILQRLLRLILDEELKVLTSDEVTPAAVTRQSDRGHPTATAPATRIPANSSNNISTASDDVHIQTTSTSNEGLSYDRNAVGSFQNNPLLRTQEDFGIEVNPAGVVGSSTRSLQATVSFLLSKARKRAMTLSVKCCSTRL
ncbi:Fungal Zn2-Cys6 binuclear cluster domain-containing protein [Cladophialophora immunda]|nr:Fungal Zn2-Cys6 binuclear cluster domain-containing protein [Cladophialophora immunda]